MSRFRAVVLPAFETHWFKREILSRPIINYICDAILNAGGSAYCAGDFCGLPEGAFALEKAVSSEPVELFSGDERHLGVAVFAPAPTITATDLTGLLDAAEVEPVCLRSGKITVAVAGKFADLQQMEPSALGHLPFIEAGEMPVVHSALGAHRAQEVLRAGINSAHLARGVFLTDVDSVFISPDAVLEPGCEILPGCQILGGSKIGAGCVVGPNCLLSNAGLEENVRVNASQIFDSEIGAGANVGPFAYIRPGCEVGRNVRVGAFVELKKSRVGDGTKISHLAYIGDSELGKRVNIGCGVITANYDGKAKHKTIVGDGSFIGSNVNLIAPLTIGEDAYLAAGSTITNDVESGALAIARARQTVKPQWAGKRKQDGKL